MFRLILTTGSYWGVIVSVSYFLSYANTSSSSSASSHHPPKLFLPPGSLTFVTSVELQGDETCSRGLGGETAADGRIWRWGGGNISPRYNPTIPPSEKIHFICKTWFEIKTHETGLCWEAGAFVHSHIVTLSQSELKTGRFNNLREGSSCFHILVSWLLVSADFIRLTSCKIRLVWSD